MRSFAIFLKRLEELLQGVEAQSMDSKEKIYLTLVDNRMKVCSNYQKTKIYNYALLSFYALKSSFCIQVSYTFVFEEF